MIIVGLTGGIGAGKSTVAKILARKGLPVYNADRVVHQLLGPGGAAVKPVAKLFLSTLKGNAIDRQALGKIVFKNPAQLKKLEKILHPLVKKAEREFLANARRQKACAAILEIPLLFETGAEARCDRVILVTAPKYLRKARVLKRKDMDATMFNAIVKQQMPEAEKRRRADHIVPTKGGLVKTRQCLKHVLSAIIA